ncbi:MAG: hypothetical protein NTV87_17685 [Ignavibacteriae bacterium]|nr:hypothetical protein [Ignavibacteriota bacterium]
MFENETSQNIFPAHQSEQYSAKSLISENRANTNSGFESLSEDDCFDEYILKNATFYSYIKSELFFTYIINIPQTINANIWRPPQNS